MVQSSQLSFIPCGTVPQGINQGRAPCGMVRPVCDPKICLNKIPVSLLAYFI